jgi:chemotaxis protein methyltransferase CheR
MEDLKSFDLEITDDAFLVLSELICQTSGIRLALEKKSLLVSRLSKRLKTLGLHGFHEYCRRVSDDKEEVVEMLNCIATNTTTFFREEYHFDFLKEHVLPELLRKSGRTLRFWSAGCSTGEEAYSIAISVCEAFRQQIGHSLFEDPDWDVRILATDISTRVLASAADGLYESQQLPDSIRPELLTRYFLKGTGMFEGIIKVKQPVKDLVSFRHLNLKEDAYPFRKTFDVIFCRNVMIYFNDDMKQHVLSRYHAHLHDNGHLFLGHAETMFGRESFKPVFITVYQKC